MRSSIGRPIDPRHPTNLAIAATTGVVFVAGLVVTFLQGAIDVGSAGRVAIAGFMAWALAREVTPDHPYAAFLATALVIGISPIAVPSLLFSFWALLTLRILNQSPGTPTHVDGIITIGLALWASSQGFWIAAPLTALAFLADSRLPQATERWKLAAIPLLGIALAWPVQIEWTLSWLHASIAFAVPLLLAKRVTSLCDLGTPMHIERVRAAVAFAAIVVLLQPQAAVATALTAAGLWKIGVAVWKK